MFRALPVFLTILFASTYALPGQQTSAGPIKVQNDSVVSYAVYARQCSRSKWRMTKHSRMHTACIEAEALRKNNETVYVAKRNDEHWVFAGQPGEWRNGGPGSCSVYRVLCKNCQLSANFKDPKDAALLANAIRKAGDATEIIYNFQDK